ncbi:hypothetical protein D3C81_1352500 [compost metagenome]
MKAIENLLPTGPADLPKRASTESATARAVSSTSRRTLWVRMAEIYGHRWTSSFGENPDNGAALTWAKGLAGVTPAQLAEGLMACLASADPWPPTLPEFRARCLGVPALAQVQLELRSPENRSAFTILVWSCIDAYRFRHASTEKSDRLIRDAYETARERVMRGGKLPTVPAAALAGPTAGASEARPCRDPEVARSAMVELDELFRMARNLIPTDTETTEEAP